jgi:3-deoxy-7-phosphoheptulonate synthase
VTELPVAHPIASPQPGAAEYPGLDAWRDLPVVQQPTWADSEVHRAAVSELSSLPPLVFAGEVDLLRQRLADAAEGKAFLLQGGDCAETFEGATADKSVPASAPSCRWLSS